MYHYDDYTRRKRNIFKKALDWTGLGSRGSERDQIEDDTWNLGSREYGDPLRPRLGTTPTTGHRSVERSRNPYEDDDHMYLVGLAPDWYIPGYKLRQGPPRDYLCKTCQHIDFNLIFDTPQKIKHKGGVAEQYYLRRIGVLHRQEWSCQFCKFVANLIHAEDGFRATGPSIVGDTRSPWHLKLPDTTDGDATTPALFLCNTDVPGYTGYRDSGRIPIHRINNALGEGRIMPKTGIDFICLRSRLFKCEMLHQRKAMLQNEEAFQHLRLIDVRSSSVVDVGSSARYVALSYIWGGIEQLRLTKENKGSLMEPGALLANWGRISKTVQDAMRFVENLSEQYLWVDTLCIIQDDAQDMEDQLGFMGVIYSSAVATIVTAFGKDASAGLPGVKPGTRRVRQALGDVGYMRLANSLGFDGRRNETPPVIKNSPWNTRAWTFQERVLSLRLFFVAEYQVLFQCSHGTFREDEVGEHDLSSDIKPKDPIERWWEAEDIYLQLPRLHLEDTHKLGYKSTLNTDFYCSMISDYTTRQLTFDSDVYNAFRGLEDNLRSSFRSNFIFGIPESEFDSALLWQPKHPRQPHNSMTRRAGFPSWSWLSWKGTIWWAKSATGRAPPISAQGTNLLWRDASKEDSSETGEWFTSDDFRAPTTNPQDFSAKWTLDQHGGIKGYYEHGPKPSITFLHPIAAETDRTYRARLKPGTQLLEFRTISAFFHLKKFMPKLSRTDPTVLGPGEMYLEDNDGYYAGNCGNPDPTADDSLDQLYEFIVLSRSSIESSEFDPSPTFETTLRESNARSETLEYKDTTSPREPRGFQREDRYGKRYDTKTPWSLFNVMAIERVDGVAYRRAVGQVHIDAFLQADPKDVHVLLG